MCRGEEVGEEVRGSICAGKGGSRPRGLLLRTLDLT